MFAGSLRLGYSVQSQLVRRPIQVASHFWLCVRWSLRPWRWEYDADVETAAYPSSSSHDQDVIGGIDQTPWAFASASGVGLGRPQGAAPSTVNARSPESIHNY